MFAITMDTEMNEVGRFELEHSKYPRNGYEKNKDGNFYKFIGDPRCITDILIAKEEEKTKIAAEQRSEKLTHFRDFLERIEKTMPCTVLETGTGTTTYRTLMLESSVRFADEYKLAHNISYKTKGWTNVGKENERTYVWNCMFSNVDLGIKGLIGIKIPYLEIFPNMNILKIWLTGDPNIYEPDIVITNILKEKNGGNQQQRPNNDNDYWHPNRFD
jgi:hypothetical protein